MSTYFGQSTIEAIVRWWREKKKKEAIEAEEPNIIKLGKVPRDGKKLHREDCFRHIVTPRIPKKIAKRMRKMGGAKE